MVRLGILKVGSTRMRSVAERRGGDYDRWFRDALEPLGVECVVVDAVADPVPDAPDWDGVIATGSPSSVHDRAPWSEAVAAWLRRHLPSGLPFLGVCYGHQLLAHAFGGATGPNPRGPEVGTFPVQIVVDDPLFEGLTRPLLAHFVHYDAVSRLPDGAQLLATSARAAVQAFRLGACAWGVQWHPEFDADGVRVALEQDRGVLTGAGQDVDALIDAVCVLPERERLLGNFVAQVRASGSGRA